MHTKLSYILAILLLLAQACKKDPGSNGNTTPTPNPVGDPPASFTRYILIEHFTGEWNPNCPTGDDTLMAMLALDSTVLSAAIHQGDWLAITPFFNDLNAHLGGVNGYPRATIDRKPATLGTQIDSTVYSIFNWRVNAQYLLANSIADCGLAIHSKESNNQLNLSVYIGYNDSIVKSTRLTVYLLEDSVQAQNQLNATPPYTHQPLVRKVLSQHLGDSIAMLDGKMITKNYTLDINGLYANKNNLRILAFVHTIGAGIKQHEVLNARRARLNETKKWD